MLRAHAIRSLFDENVEGECKAFILTTTNGMLQGCDAFLPETAAKRASALCGLVWRSHADKDFHTSSASSFATHAVEALAIRRTTTGDIASILFTIAEKDSGRPIDPAASDVTETTPIGLQTAGLRLWAVAPVKDRMLIAAAGSVSPSSGYIEDSEKLVLVNKAEGMADYLKQELRGFIMPGGNVKKLL